MISSLLESTIEKIKEHEKEANKNGELFNIFNILKARRSEVNTHSRFLTELLNPKGSHGEDDLFTKLFIETLDPKLAGALTGTCIVKREDQTSGRRRIDITIEYPHQLIIGIELKVDAGDQNSQLYDYFTELKARASSGTKTRLIYLTLDGKEASAESLTSRCKKDNLTASDYQAISFKTHILDWLDKCISARGTSKTELIYSINQYYKLIKSLTGTDQTMANKTSDLITASLEKFNAAIEIEKALTKSKIDLQSRFWQKLEKKLNEDTSKRLYWFQGEDKYNENSPKSSIESLVGRYVRGKKNSKPMGLKYQVCSVVLNGIQCNIYFYIRLQRAIQFGIRAEDDTQNPISLDEPSKQELIALYEKTYIAEHTRHADAVTNKSHEGWILGYYRNHGDDALNFYELKDLAKKVLFDENAMELEIKSIAEQHKRMVNFAKNEIGD